MSAREYILGIILGAMLYAFIRESIAYLRLPKKKTVDPKPIQSQYHGIEGETYEVSDIDLELDYEYHNSTTNLEELDKQVKNRMIDQLAEHLMSNEDLVKVYKNEERRVILWRLNFKYLKLKK